MAGPLTPFGFVPIRAHLVEMRAAAISGMQIFGRSDFGICVLASIAWEIGRLEAALQKMIDHYNFLLMEIRNGNI